MPPRWGSVPSGKCRLEQVLAAGEGKGTEGRMQLGAQVGSSCCHLREQGLEKQLEVRGEARKSQVGPFK